MSTTETGWPEFTVTIPVIWFAVLVGLVIAITVTVELYFSAQPVTPKMNNDEELFDKVEEYRNDFPDDGRPDHEVPVGPIAGDFDCCRGDGGHHDGGPLR